MESQSEFERKRSRLHQHAIQLSDAKNLDEIITLTTDTMINTLGFAWVGFTEVTDNFLGYSMRIHDASSEEPIEAVFCITFHDTSITARAYRTGESQLRTDAEIDVDYHRVSLNESTRLKLEDPFERMDVFARLMSEIEVPVKIDETVVAVLGGESTELNRFNELDQKLLETLASYVASAIQRVRTREAMI